MRFRCHMPSCGQPPRGFEFEGRSACPKCGASGVPHVVPLVDVHLTVLDAAGPILGGAGRQFLACQPRRDHLARGQHDPFGASDDPLAVTCPACRRTDLWKVRAREHAELAEELAEVEALPVSVMMPAARRG